MKTSALLRHTLPLLLAVSLFAACSDDDTASRPGVPDDTTTTEPERLALAQQGTVRNLLCELAAVDSLPADFEQHTYTPDFGQVLDEARPHVRTLRADTPEEAEQLFRGLVLNAQLLTATADGLCLDLRQMKWTPGGPERNFGTLTFHRGDKSGLTGYVEVNVPCIPTLERIEYADSASIPHNAGYTTPYKVGEVVYVDSNNRTRNWGYYLCVRAYTGPGSTGLLVRFEKDAGKEGDCSIKFDSGERGGWRPVNPGTINDFNAYLNFFATKTSLKKKVLKFTESGIPYGFCRKDDTVFDQTSSYSSAPLFIINGWFGDWRWGTFYYWRCVSYIKGPAYAPDGEGFTSGQFDYTAFSSWEDFVKDYAVWTMNVVYFNRYAPAGTSSVFDPAAR